MSYTEIIIIGYTYGTKQLKILMSKGHILYFSAWGKGRKREK